MRASKPSYEIKNRCRCAELLLAINLFQRGIRIIVIEEIFATSISLFFWSKLSCANSFLIHFLIVILDKCKQLSCEQIDDRITSNKLMKAVLNKIEITYQDLANP
jgi:hypothetical protein